VELNSDMNAPVPETPFDTRAFVDGETQALIASECADAADAQACASGHINAELGPENGDSNSAVPITVSGAGVPMDVVLSRLNSTVRSPTSLSSS
jgi:hypothetical protein